ncbi:LOW QUALITY PROTEIN: armadillo-like helical domain-containing protein 4 [Heteronotia binoei]|uniref:LOW QUALITY PROTEIN: armadillo-like helical domain-containing protein 4 n=1 Tax=Heteronotia binoei TaxID=13085 RepID=UPI00292F3B80|nr:LOW QUALITY PROTEIN: armadillo-like helical domain-containing protein 4 [Heteronotia binoei]
MNESTASPARVAICLILLGSCSLQCLAFRNTERRHARRLQQRAALAEPRLGDTDNVSASNPEGHSELPEQTVGAAAASETPYGASAEPSGISLTPWLKRRRKLCRGDISNPNVKDQVCSSTASETMGGASEGAAHDSTGNPGGDIFEPSILEEGGSIGRTGVPPLITEDSLLGLPSDRSPSLLPSAGQSLHDVERVAHGDGPSPPTDTTAKSKLVSTAFDQDEDTLDGWGHSRVTPGAATAVLATALPSDDWDDTKLGAASQARETTATAASQSQTVGEPYPGEGEEEDDDEVRRVFPPRLLATAAKGSQNLQTGPVRPPLRTSCKDPRGCYCNRHDQIGCLPNQRDTLKGATQEVAAALPKTDAVLSTTVPGDFPTQEATGEGRARELASHIPEDLGSSVLPEKPENFVTPASPLAADLFVIPTPEAGGPTAALVKKEDAAVDEAPATPAGMLTGEIPGATVATSALASVPAAARRTTIPAAHQVTTAATYGLDGLESEEEEEEEEDEEEEEEEEPDEEEEEEDDEDEKDANLMNESLEGDAGQDGFTLPEETSQDPLESLENPVGELSGVSYQVPGAIEWERQNQGLVRNWMKKLKDKVTYVPCTWAFSCSLNLDFLFATVSASFSSHVVFGSSFLSGHFVVAPPNPVSEFRKCPQAQKGWGLLA